MKKNLLWDWKFWPCDVPPVAVETQIPAIQRRPLSDLANPKVCSVSLSVSYKQHWLDNLGFTAPSHPLAVGTRICFFFGVREMLFFFGGFNYIFVDHPKITPQRGWFKFISSKKKMIGNSQVLLHATLLGNKTWNPLMITPTNRDVKCCAVTVVGWFEMDGIHEMVNQRNERENCQFLW